MTDHKIEKNSEIKQNEDKPKVDELKDEDLKDVVGGALPPKPAKSILDTI